MTHEGQKWAAGRPTLAGYLGEEAATRMVAAMDQPGTVQAQVTVRPTWVGLLDFTTRLPSSFVGV